MNKNNLEYLKRKQKGWKRKVENVYFMLSHAANWGNSELKRQRFQNLNSFFGLRCMTLIWRKGALIYCTCHSSSWKVHACVLYVLTFLFVFTFPNLSNESIFSGLMERSSSVLILILGVSLLNFNLIYVWVYSTIKIWVSYWKRCNKFECLIWYYTWAHHTCTFNNLFLVCITTLLNSPSNKTIFNQLHEPSPKWLVLCRLIRSHYAPLPQL